jgi:hypothetical protein
LLVSFFLCIFVKNIIIGWNVINIFAIMVSWYFNKSVLWAIFHWIFGLLYLIYCLLIGRFADGGFMENINHYF